MTHDEQQSILRKLELMRAMTTTRGCTPAEADVTALKIGQALQQYPIVLSFEQPKPQQPPGGGGKQKQPTDSLYDWVGEVVTLKGMTEKAMLFSTDSEQYGDFEFWVPKSQVRGDCVYWTIGDSGPLHTTRWWAEKEGWE